MKPHGCGNPQDIFNDVSTLLTLRYALAFAQHKGSQLSSGVGEPRRTDGKGGIQMLAASLSCTQFFYCSWSSKVWLGAEIQAQITDDS